MNSRFFDFDPTTGLSQFYHYNPDRDEFHIETRQDAEPILDQNRQQRVETDRHTRWGDGMQKVATLPLTVVAELAKKGIMSAGGEVLDRQRFFAFLNDPENLAFRTREGRL